MKIRAWAVVLSVWLAFSLAGTALIVSRAVAEAHNRFFQDSSIAIRLLGQKSAQHVAMLATLGETRLLAPPPHMLDSLRARTPQLTAIAY